MTNEQKRKFDLSERTARFGESIITFTNGFKHQALLQPLLIQLVRSATSIGANYSEADEAESRKDFKHKIGICKKEARETQYWLRMIAHAKPDIKEKCRELWREAKELTLIFNAILNSANKITPSNSGHSVIGT